LSTHSSGASWLRHIPRAVLASDAAEHALRQACICQARPACRRRPLQPLASGPASSREQSPASCPTEPIVAPVRGLLPGDMHPGKRPRGDAPTLRELSALSGGTRAGLARVLRCLRDRGYLANADRLLGGPAASSQSPQAAERAAGAALAAAGMELVEVPQAAGPVVVQRGGLHVVRLQSLLQLLCKESRAFSELMAATIQQAGGRKLGLVLYLDEVKPGNPLRPDPARSSWAVYCQLADVPAWARSCTAAALPLCVVRTQELAPLGGPLGPQRPREHAQPKRLPAAAGIAPGAFAGLSRRTPSKPSPGRTCCGR
jgi:hypothetical protein